MKTLSVAAAALSLVMATNAVADWPEKPVKLVVPFAAGGTTDLTARAFQQAANTEKLLSEPVSVVNIGGHFSMGLRQVKDAEPDGHTFTIMHVALMTGQASGMLDFGYKDFVPVARMGAFCEVAAVRSDLGVKSVDELLQKAADKPDSVVAGVNLGALNHTFMLMLEDLKPGAKFRFVQTGGDAKSYTALAGKHTDAGAMAAGSAISYTRSGDQMNPDSGITLLAYSGPERNPGLPEVPTLKELGHDIEFCIDMWYFAPKGTPKAAIDGFASAVKQSLDTEVVQKYFKSKAMVGSYLAGDALAKNLDEQWVRIEPVAKRAKKK
ncbi:MAG: tripartite tricarboxylate transporter substrate binding protein [Rhodospirillales bacterium]